FAFKHIKSKTLVLVLGAIAAIVLYAFAGISGRESGGAAEDGIDASAMGRLYAWEAAFKMALHHPLTGVGLDNFYFNYYFYSPHWDGINHAVHSTWFGVLAETGFVGLAVFITLIVSLIRTSLHSISLLTPKSDYTLSVGANAVLSGLIGTIVSGTFLTQGFTCPIYILAALT
ncbi:O-antigen ligase family protein, partial [Vibrio parahaemolyticus]|nr:O-antigen ligase family protein [Vibrio parahaemolyticus]